MSDNALLPAVPVYSAGDILVTAAADGFEVARVSGNGRSIHVMGVQGTELAALHMAARATSGSQRVFLRHDPGSTEYRLVNET